jgi:sugar lactone lactonase YvrE
MLEACAQSWLSGAMRAATFTSLVFTFTLLGCSNTPDSSPPDETIAPPPADPVPETPAPAPPSEPVKPAPKPAVSWSGMATPESVLHDVERDVYLVSNINGKPLDADNNGYISVLSPDGTVTTPKLIEGGKKVTLNAPKGMALVKGTLYVSDIDTVRAFDAKTGAHKGDIAIKGATFLNDLAAGKDGKIYVSDSGMKQGAKDFEPTGTDAVHVIHRGKAKLLASSKEFGRPNGLLVDDKGGVWVAPFGAAEIFRIGGEATKEEVTKIPAPGLDGLVMVGDQLIVSSWQGKAIYRGKPGGAFEPVLEGLNAPADFTYDAKRQRLIVPRFLDNVVEAYDLK